MLMELTTVQVENLSIGIDAVKLGHNNHGYNKFTAITNNYSSTFLVSDGIFII